MHYGMHAVAKLVTCHWLCTLQNMAVPLAADILEDIQHLVLPHAAIRCFLLDDVNLGELGSSTLDYK